MGTPSVPTPKLNADGDTLNVPPRNTTKLNAYETKLNASEPIATTATTTTRVGGSREEGEVTARGACKTQLPCSNLKGDGDESAEQGETY